MGRGILLLPIAVFIFVCYNREKNGGIHMKKRRFWLILLACLSLCLCLFAGCSKKPNLDFGVKYYSEYDISEGKDKEEWKYYRFNKNGTGEYYYYNAYGEKIEDYTIIFKYTVVDKDSEAVACFYDGIKYGDKHNVEWDYTNHPQKWSSLLTVSDDVLMTKGGSLFIGENYLEEIPNFGLEQK